MKILMKTRSVFSILIILLIAITTKAQENETSPVDTLADYTAKLSSSFIKLEKLKVSGYIQAQFQKADTAGISSMAGGSFPAHSDNIFKVRRGRLKFQHTGDHSQFVVQFDITEKGMGIKDAYAKFTDPFVNVFSITSGVFNRPFGYEIGYSSSKRESPERSRIIQTLFPGERDLGAMLTIQAPKTSSWHFLKLDAGIFAGNGPQAEFDNGKDFIGRLGIEKATRSENMKYGLGVSYYNGRVYQGTNNLFEMNNAGTSAAFSKIVADSIPGTLLKREYLGVDAQFNLESFLGITSVMAEYVSGTQPSALKSNASPSKSIPDYDTYLRNVRGAYVYFIQSIAGTRHSIIAKYDFFDPNTKVKGDEIGLKESGQTATTSADLQYTTLGLGWICAINSNTRMTLYYDIVTNETSSNLSGYSKDLKDNVITLRLQYKF